MDNYCSSSTQSDANDVLELSLKDILSLIKPSEHDRAKRLNTISELATCIRSVESLKGAVVQPFGSFVSDLYTKWADLDLSIELSSTPWICTSRKQKQNLLKDIMRTLRRKGVASKCQFIPKAKVPLLIYESSYYSISCDVSINNHIGQIKSKILLWITNIDERFHDMVLLIKEWAKKQNINDPKSGTLNSYSLCLLVILHFQTCAPAILPPMKEIYGGNVVDDLTGTESITERHIEDVCAANITRFKSQTYGRRNQSSLFHLLVTFFEKFSRIETVAATEYAICTYTGRLERISGNPKWMEKSHCLLIEDPFEQPDNAARAVDLRGLSKIVNAFRDAYYELSSGSVPLERDTLLAFLTRPVICTQLMLRPRGHPQIARSGYAVLQPQGHPRIERSGYAGFKSQGHQGHPRIERSGYAVLEPQGHPRIEHSGYAVVKPRRSQGRPQIERSGYAVPELPLRSQGHPRIGHSGYAVLEPIQYQLSNPPRLDENLPSSSAITSQRPVAVRMPSQKLWRPRYIDG